MATDKRHIRTQLRREILKTLTLTNDPELRAKMQTQLIDLLGVNKAAKAMTAKPGKGAKPADSAVLSPGADLLG